MSGRKQDGKRKIPTMSADSPNVWVR